MADRLGVSSAVDGVLVSLVVPTAFANLMINSLPIAIVPAFIRARRVQDRDAADLVTRGYLGVAVTAGTLGSLIAVFLTPALQPIIGPGLDDLGRATLRDASSLTAPIVAAGATSAVVVAIAQAAARPWIAAVAWIAGGVAALLLVAFGWPSMGVMSYAAAPAVAFGVTSVIGACLLLGAGVVRPSIAIPRAGLIEPIRHATPLAAGTAFSQFNEVFDRAIATLVGAGSVSVLRYAEQIATAPARFVLPGWFGAIYPALTHRQQADQNHSGRDAQMSVRFAVALTLPLAGLVMASAPVLVSIAYGRGSFDASARFATSTTLVAFGPLICLATVNAILVAAHGALEHRRLLGLASVGNALLNLVLDLVLGAWFGVPGIALATSLTGLGVAAALVARLGRDWPPHLRDELAQTVARTTLATLGASALVAAVVWSIDWTSVPFLAQVLSAALSITGGLSLFLLAGTLIRLPELQTLLSIARAQLRR